MSNHTPKTGRAAVNGAELTYEIAGDGPPLVFIHAGVADSRQWNNEFAAFAGEHRVVRYDLRGYGRSEPVAGEFRHLADLEALLDQLEVHEPVVLVGCSMGGRLAIEVALAHPERVRGLVLVGSGPNGLELDVPLPEIISELQAADEAGDLERLAELEAQLWIDGPGRAADEVDPAVRQLGLEMNRQALAYEAMGLGEQLPDAEQPAAERLSELTMPALIVVGEYDVPYALAAATYMVENLPNARQLTLPNAAHLANMDQPARFAAALREFLAELPE